MARQTPEGRVKDAIKKALKNHHPDSFFFLPVSNGMGRHGIPDFVCCIPVEITQDMVGQKIGMFAGIEAKTATGKVSALQAACLNEIGEAHGATSVIRGSEFADLAVKDLRYMVGGNMWEAEK